MAQKLKSFKSLQIFNISVDPRNMSFSGRLSTLRKRKIMGLSDWYEKRKNSCAIVGNSGILLNSQCGAIIDRSDIIVRMNLAPFGHEYSSGVGSRVDFNTFNNEQLREWRTCFLDTPGSDKGVSKDNNTRQRNLTLECEGVLSNLKLLQDNNGTLWLFKNRLQRLTNLLSVLREHYRLNFRFAYSPLNPVFPVKK